MSPVREAYLALTRHTPCILPYPIELVTERDMVGFVCWMNTRMIKIDALCLEKQCVSACTEISALSLSKVTAVRIKGEKSMDFSTSVFRALLELVPALSSLDMDQCYMQNEEEYLQVLAAHCLPLKSIPTASTKHSAQSYCFLFNAFAGTLEALSLRSYCVDDESLTVLGQSCRRLKSLSLHANLHADMMLMHFASASSFCSLEHLTLRSSLGFSQVTDSTLIEICRAHPVLRSLVCEGNTSILLSLCAAALAICSQLDYISNFSCRYQVQRAGPDPGSCCELAVYTENNQSLATDLPKIVSLRPYPLRSFDDYQNALSQVRIAALADTCGADLHSLAITPASEVDKSTLLHLAQTCVSLEVLTLSGNFLSTISDSVVMAFADHCSALHEVSLCALWTITIDCIVHLLSACGQQLLKFCLVDYDHEAVDLLPQIAILCPNLRKLELMYVSSLRAGEIGRHLIVPNHLKRLETLRLGPHHLLMQVQELIHNDLRVNTARWKATLQN